MTQTAHALILPAVLDLPAIAHLREVVRRSPAHGELHLDASQVTTLDPVGALALWSLCRDLAELQHRTPSIGDLSPRLVRSLRQHPLSRFLVEDDTTLFQDPFATLGASTR